MPKSATDALAWCSDVSLYHVRAPEHARTLAAIFGDTLMLTPESPAWFEWLTGIPSFAFEGDHSVAGATRLLRKWRNAVEKQPGAAPRARASVRVAHPWNGLLDLDERWRRRA